MMKRAVDIVFAAVGLVIFAPLLLIVVLLTTLEGAGSVLFRQERIGKGGKPFFILKFRTMAVDPSRSGSSITVGEDQRITRVGRVLRKTKIDELPQLINVLKGDMSLVGPRPEVRRYVELFPRDYEVILAVRPGITDPASLKFRDEAAVLGRSVDPEQEYVQRVLPQKIRLSRDYLAHASLTRDLTLVVQTVAHVAWENVALAVLSLRSQPLVVAGVYLILIVLANYLAFLLPLGGRILVEHWDAFLRMLPWLVMIQGATLIPLRLNRKLSRSSEALDSLTLILGVLASTLLFYILVRGIIGIDAYPRSVFFLNAILLILLLGSIRQLARIFRHPGQVEQENQVLPSKPGVRQK
jgi:lipopolysaccharide/colanic/teichoic acid biosynthesis glycosyltransferase